MSVLLLLGAVAACGQAQSNLPDFAGAWVLKYQSRTFLVLTLRVDHDQITGTLVRPEHFSFDQDGDFTHITRQHVEARVSEPVFAGKELQFSAQTGPDQHRFAMTLVDRDLAILRTLDIAVQVPPWRLQRANSSDDADIASDWPEQNPVTKDIAALQVKLKRMADADQAVRTTNPISEKRMQEVDRIHRSQILQIYRKYGWPKTSVVGKDAAGSFWLLVQHQDLSLQRRMLPEMQRAVEAGEASVRNFVFLYDRVMKGEGKPQHWGTQTSCVNGKAVLDPVDDPSGLENRRRELYLPPIGQYVDSLSPQCQNLLHDLPGRK